MQGLNVTVRFFVYDYSGSDDAAEMDIIEVPEDVFIEHTGNITYERHTIFANGVSQICLTKGLE